MTEAQKRAFESGYQDRLSGRNMREFLAPHIANAYRNGYVDACEDAAVAKTIGVPVEIIARV